MDSKLSPMRTEELLGSVGSMFWSNQRLETYKKWPFDVDQTCNAQNMAAAGFFCLEDNDEPDLVQCFICNKQLNGWEPDDDPWSEHKKHQPDCPLILLGKKEEKLYTIRDLYDLKLALETQKMKSLRNDMLAELEELAGELEKDLRSKILKKRKN